MDPRKIDPSKKLHQTGASPAYQEGLYSKEEGAQPKAKIDSQGTGSPQKDLLEFSVELESPNNDNQAQRVNSFYEGWSNEDYQVLVDAFGKDDVASKDPNELFFHSVHQNKAAALDAFLRDERIDVNQQDSLGNTPLTCAAQGRHSECLKILLANTKVDVNLKNRYGQPPIMWVVIRNDAESLKAFLLRNDLDVNTQNSHGNTPLIQAVSFGRSKECIEILLEDNNTNVNIENNDGDTALLLAAKKGGIESMRALIRREDLDVNKADIDGRTLLIKAASVGQTETLKILLSHKNIDINKKDRDGNGALTHAAVYGHSECLKALLEHDKTLPKAKKLDLNTKSSNGNTPLIWSASRGHAECLKLLLEHDKTELNEQNSRGSTALMEAADRRQTECVKTLLAEEDVYDDIAEALSQTQKNTPEQYIFLTTLPLLFNIGSTSNAFIKHEGKFDAAIPGEIAKDFDEMTQKHALKGDFWSKNATQMGEYFSPLAEATKRNNKQDIITLIRSGNPCVIPSGFPGHALSISIRGNWLSIENRGDKIDYNANKSHLNQPGSCLYHIPNLREKLSPEFIERLLNKDVSALQEIQSMEHTQVLRIPRKGQKRGNCSYANAKLLVQDHLIFFVAEQKGIKLEDIKGENDPRWKEIVTEARLLYRDFTILQRVQAFNEYAEKYFDASNPKECELIASMYQEIKQMVSNKATGQSGCFQVLDIRDHTGEEIPILEQLNLGGVTAAKEIIHSRVEALFQERKDFYKNWRKEDYLTLIETFGAQRLANESPNELFLKSAKEGKTKALEAFLRDNEIDVNQLVEKGYTPLGCAAIGGHFGCVKLLLNDPRVNVNLRGEGVLPPIALTVIKNDIESLKAFLAHDDIDISQKNSNGMTALGVASMFKKTNFEELLIAHQNAKTKGTTEDPPQPTA